MMNLTMKASGYAVTLLSVIEHGNIVSTESPNKDSGLFRNEGAVAEEQCSESSPDT